MDAEIDDGSGSATLSGLGDLTVDDGSGELYVEDIQGSVDIDDGSGELESIGGGRELHRPGRPQPADTLLGCARRSGHS